MTEPNDVLIREWEWHNAMQAEDNAPIVRLVSRVLKAGQALVEDQGVIIDKLATRVVEMEAEVARLREAMALCSGPCSQILATQEVRDG